MTKYYFNKIIDLPFEKAIEHVTEELKKEGFGVLTEIDVQATLKKKLDVDFRPYRILGACNPPFAHKALSAEPILGYTSHATSSYKMRGTAGRKSRRLTQWSPCPVSIMLDWNRSQRRSR